MSLGEFIVRDLLGVGKEERPVGGYICLSCGDCHSGIESKDICLGCIEKGRRKRINKIRGRSFR